MYPQSPAQSAATENALRRFSPRQRKTAAQRENSAIAPPRSIISYTAIGSVIPQPNRAAGPSSSRTGTPIPKNQRRFRAGQIFGKASASTTGNAPDTDTITGAKLPGGVETKALRR